MVFLTHHFHMSEPPQTPRVGGTSKAQVCDPPARMSSARPSAATGRASARRERPPKPSWPSWTQKLGHSGMGKCDMFRKPSLKSSSFDLTWAIFEWINHEAASIFSHCFPMEHRSFLGYSPFSDTPNGTTGDLEWKTQSVSETSWGQKPWAFDQEQMGM